MNASFSGEFRAVVTGSDGVVVTDTGYQENLILDQGLDFFGGLHGGSSRNAEINRFCVIGTGNSVPQVGQTALDSAVAMVSGTDKTNDFLTAVGADKMYRLWEQKKYTFSDLGNVTIRELGLASEGVLSEHSLMTRALTKNYLDEVTPITVKEGDVLDIFYRFHKVINTGDSNSFVVDVHDGLGASTPYNVKVKSTDASSPKGNSVVNPLAILPQDIYNSVDVSSSDLHPLTGTRFVENNLHEKLSILSLEPYNQGAFKRVLMIELGIGNGNIPTGIRTIFTQRNGRNSDGAPPVPFMPIQIRFGSVEDDTPLEKNSGLEIKIPIEYSWGRSEHPST